MCLKKRDLICSLVLFSYGILSRIPFASKVFTYWDAPQFAIALRHFSVKEHFPAPPGHFLYVMAAKLLDFFFKDANNSFVALGVLFTALTAVALFLIGLRIFGFKAGLAASLVYLSGPAFWYHSITYFPYPMNGFLSLVSGYLFYRTVIKRHDASFVLGSLFYALMAGVRPVEVFFLLPLWCWAFFNAKVKYRIMAIAVFIVTCLAWFIPLMAISGGLEGYFGALSAEVSSGSSRFSDSIFSVGGLLKANLKYELIVYFLAFGLAAIPFLYYLPQYFGIKMVLQDRQKKFFLAWMLPSLLFWLAINFNSSGYVIVSLMPSAILLGQFLVSMSYDLGQGLFAPKSARNMEKIFLAFLLCVIFAVNNIYYLYDFSPGAKEDIRFISFMRYSDIKKLNEHLTAKLAYIENNFSASETIIVVSSEYFMQVMYYLEKYEAYPINDISRQDAFLVVRAQNLRRDKVPAFKISDLFKSGKTKNIIFFDDRFKDDLSDQNIKFNTVSVLDKYNMSVVRLGG